VSFLREESASVVVVCKQERQVQTLANVVSSRDLQLHHESVVFNQVETMRDPLKLMALPRLHQQHKCLGLKKLQDLRTCATPVFASYPTSLDIVHGEHEGALINFVSQEWLGYDEADPQRVHLRTMQEGGIS
jgi:hypothetical protein